MSHTTEIYRELTVTFGQKNGPTFSREKAGGPFPAQNVDQFFPSNFSVCDVAFSTVKLVIFKNDVFPLWDSIFKKSSSHWKRLIIWKLFLTFFHFFQKLEFWQNLKILKIFFKNFQKWRFPDFSSFLQIQKSRPPKLDNLWRLFSEFWGNRQKFHFSKFFFKTEEFFQLFQNSAVFQKIEKTSHQPKSVLFSYFFKIREFFQNSGVFSKYSNFR